MQGPTKTSKSAAINSAFGGDLFSIGASATPVKRPRTSGVNNGGGGNNAKITSSSPITPASASRPFSAGPSRLNSSPSTSTPNGKSSSQSVPFTPFAERPTPLSLQESLNDHLERPPAPAGNGKQRTKLFAKVEPSRFNYRYMHEKMMERSEVLDDGIDEGAAILKKFYSIEEFGDPSLQSQEDVLCVGRLCAENDSIKLGETTTWLESSRTLGSGKRVLLKFDHDMKVRGAPMGSGGIGLFPGEIVGVRGKNGGGKLFSVNEIMMMPPIDATYTRPSDLLAAQYGQGVGQLDGHPHSIIVASGPFTLDADLEFAPLKVLLNQVQLERTDIMILCGPFIDSSHPLLSSGETDHTPLQLFRKHFSEGFEKVMIGHPKLRVLMVPNGRDLLSTHVAYPQSPLSKVELNLPKGVSMIPNPTLFSINETAFAVTSVDVLFHLRNQEFFKKCGEADDPTMIVDGQEEDPNAKDIMARTCRHLLRQRSFYPIFPAPLPSKGIDPINLDISHNDLVRMGEFGPDIVITPSLLKHFVKIVDSTIMLNPAFLTRGNAPGTFARLTIHPMPKEMLEIKRKEMVMTEQGETEEEIEHRIFERCRVDIVKI